MRILGRQYERAFLRDGLCLHVRAVPLQIPRSASETDRRANLRRRFDRARIEDTLTKTRTPEEIIGSLESRALQIKHRQKGVADHEVANYTDAARILELLDEMKVSINELRYSASLAVAP